MLSNLFKVKLSLKGLQEINFQPIVVRRLLKMHPADSFVKACLNQNDQKVMLLPLLKMNYVLNNNNDMAILNKYINSSYDNNLGVHYFTHKLRMTELAKICREGLQIESIYFNWYFQSVVALTQLSSEVDASIVAEIFNDALICADLQDVILAMKNNTLPLISFVSDESFVFPHRTGWEALLVTRLRDEVGNDPKTCADALGLMKNLVHDGCFVEFVAQLFIVVVNNLKQEPDIHVLMNISQQLIDFLTAQQKLSHTLTVPLRHLFVILLSQAQHQKKQFIYLLRDYSEELIRLGAIKIFDDLLSMLAQPKNKRDTNNNYYSTLALVRVLCLMMNTNIIDSHVVQIEAMPEVDEPIYRRYLEIYSNHYAQLLFARYNADSSFSYAYDVLKLYRFQQPEGFEVINRRVVAQALAISIDNMSADNDVDTDYLLIIEALPDFYSYAYIVELYIRLRAQPGTYFEQITTALFPLILVPKAEDEAQKNYLQRLSAIIMLIVKYDLPSKSCFYYLPLMGYKVGSEVEFNYIVKEQPKLYAKAMIGVYEQFCEYYGAAPLPRNFLLEILNVSAEAMIKNGPFSGPSDHMIRNLFKSLSTVEANDILLNLSPEHFKALMSAYAGCYIVHYSNTPYFPYNKLRELLTDVNFTCKSDFNTLLNNSAKDNLHREYWHLLLYVGADPLHGNNSCPLLISIQSYGNLITEVCSATKAKTYQLDFEKLHTMCHDPLGLAVLSGASVERVQLMIDAGFHVDRYDYDPPLGILNIAAHNLICQLQAQIFREQRRIAAEMRLRFIQPSANLQLTNQGPDFRNNNNP